MFKVKTCEVKFNDVLKLRTGIRVKQYFEGRIFNSTYELEGHFGKKEDYMYNRGKERSKFKKKKKEKQSDGKGFFFFFKLI